MSKLKGILLTEGMHGMLSQVEGLAKALDIEFTHHKVELNNLWKLIPSKFTPISQSVYKKINYSELDFLPFEMTGFFNRQFIIEQITSFFPKLLSKIENIRSYFSGDSQWTFKTQKLNKNGIQAEPKPLKT